jgi:prepilin-type N-terminal cleavage/methylation domain-containing protein
LNRKTSISGFTLIELVIVLTIICLTLFFSVPVLKNIHIFSNSDNEIDKLLFLIGKLKNESVHENKNMTLHIDILEQQIWIVKEVTKAKTEFYLEEEKENIVKKSSIILSQIRILSVEFTGEKQFVCKNDQNEYQIRFNSNGYSDMALIHLRDKDDNDITIIIEPFLLKAGIEDKYISFEDCT